MSISPRRRKQNSGAVCISFIVIVFLIIIGVQIVHLRQKADDYEERLNALQEQYEMEIQRQTEITDYEAYTKTTDYIEDIAKSKLGLAYDNEIIFKESN